MMFLCCRKMSIDSEDCNVKRSFLPRGVDLFLKAWAIIIFQNGLLPKLIWIVKFAQIKRQDPSKQKTNIKQHTQSIQQ
jgi:hypothetical protein